MIRHPGRLLALLILLLLTLANAPRSGVAQPEPPPVAPPAVGVDPVTGPEAASPTPTTPQDSGASLGRDSLWRLVRQANPMLWPLVICSVVTLGFALERLVALRRNRVVPKDFTERFLERLAAGKLDRDRAAELCRANDSPVARIFGRIVHHWGQPSGVIREAVASEAAVEVVELKRNVRVLNGAATLAPLLGLLGTVVGMIEAFDALGNRTAPGVGKSEALAHGISLALIATAFGLAIAVVAVVMYYYLLNRLDVLVRTMDQEATQVIDLVAGDSALRVPIDYRRPPLVPGELARHEVRGT